MNVRRLFQVLAVLLAVALVMGCTQRSVQTDGTNKPVVTNQPIQADEAPVLEDPAFSDLNALDSELGLPDAPQEDYTQ